MVLCPCCDTDTSTPFVWPCMHLMCVACAVRLYLAKARKLACPLCRRAWDRGLHVALHDMAQEHNVSMRYRREYVPVPIQVSEPRPEIPLICILCCPRGAGSTDRRVRFAPYKNSGIWILSPNVLIQTDRSGPTLATLANPSAVSTNTMNTVHHYSI